MGESELAKELLDSIKSKTSKETIMSNYFVYERHLKTRRVLGYRCDENIEEIVNKIYHRWKKDNNIQ